MQIFRFSTGVRLFHWSVAVPVLLLLGSGLTMTAHSLGLLPMLSKATLLSLHTGLGLLFPLLPLLVLFIAKHTMIAKEILPAFNVNWSDLQWGAAMARSLFNKDTEVPPQGKFNGGQKMNAVMSLIWISTLCISGIVMTISKGNVLAHGVHIFAVALFVPGLLVHLFMATINPSTRCSLGGMIHGYVPDHYLIHHHGLYFKQFAPQYVDTLFVSQLTRKKDLHSVYHQLYRDTMSFPDFKQLCADSELLVGVWKKEMLILFFRVVGDRCRTGFVVDMTPMPSQHTPSNIPMDQIITATESIVGHPLILP